MSYPPEVGSGSTDDPDRKREAVLRVVSAAAFLIFFQAYLVAPLIPALSIQFHESAYFLGMLVPTYMLPYGISTLFYGPISDRVGRKPVILVLLGVMVVTIAGVATSQNASQMMMWRLLGGIASGGIVPIALALLGDLFPYEQRGRPIGWMFGAIAGGMAFGSSFGALLNPVIGWRAEFLTRRDLFSSAAQRLHFFMLALRLDHEGVTCGTTPCVIGHNRSVQEKQVDSGLVIDGRAYVCESIDESLFASTSAFPDLYLKL